MFVFIIVFWVVLLVVDTCLFCLVCFVYLMLGLLIVCLLIVVLDGINLLGVSCCRLMFGLRVSLLF